MLDNLQVELVQLQPWLSWQLFLSVLTMMGYFCDFPVSTSSEVKWTNILVLNTYSSWSDAMLLYSPCHISRQSCAIPDNYKWLILCREVESRILILQFLGGLPARYWSNNYKGKRLLLYASDNTIPLQPAVASGHSEMVPLLQSRGVQATVVVSDCVAVIYLALYSAHTDLNFLSTSLTIVVVFIPRVDERQPSQALGAGLTLNQLVEGQPSDTFNVICIALFLKTDSSCQERSSWNCAMASVDQRMLRECSPCVWNSFEVDLVIAGFLHNFVSCCLTSHNTQPGSELTQLTIAWLFSQPLLENWFQFSPTGQHFLSATWYHITELSSKGMGSWSYVVHNLHQRMLQHCKAYVWLSCGVRLLIDSFLQPLDTSCITCHIIQCGSEPTQFKIAWFFSLQLVANWFQCCPVSCLVLAFLEALSPYCYFAYALAWEQQVCTAVNVANCYPRERSSRDFHVPVVEQTMLTRGHIILRGFEIIQWEIPWSLDMRCSCDKYRNPFPAITLIDEAYLEQDSATTLQCFAAMRALWTPAVRHHVGLWASRILRGEDCQRPFYLGCTLGSMMGCKPGTWACSYHREQQFNDPRATLYI